MAAVFSAGGRWMEGHIDRNTAVEGDGWEVLIEERLEHDDLIAMFQEGDEYRVLSWRLASGNVSDRYSQ